MNYEQITGILRAVVPALLSYCVGKGWITQSDVGDITAAVVSVGAAAWSVANNRTGKINGTGGLIASPGMKAGGGIGAAILFLMLSLPSAHSQTALPVKAPPMVAPVVGCTLTSCTGFFAGGVVYGIGGNAAILQNGIAGSVFAGGGDAGINIGWQYWDAKYFASFDTDLMLESSNNAGVTNFAGGGFVGILHAKLGGNFLGLISGGPAPITPPLSLASVIMASYIDNCVAFRKNGTQYCGGAGTQFWLSNKMTLDLLYDYAPQSDKLKALQNVGAKVSWHF